MRTVLIQAYSGAIPEWMSSCMKSVRIWANLKQFEYQFFGDDFLTLVPRWYRKKANGQICVESDLARLLLAKRLLCAGADRVIWIDTDVVVWEPQRFEISEEVPFGFIKEVWLWTEADNRILCRKQVTNSVCVFCRNSMDWLAGYIEDCEAIVSAVWSRDLVETATRYLTLRHRAERLPLIDNVGVFGATVMNAITARDNEPLRELMRKHGQPLYAANLCNTGSRRQVSAEEKVSVVKDLLLIGDKWLNGEILSSFRECNGIGQNTDDEGDRKSVV